MSTTPRTDAEFGHFPTSGPTLKSRIEKARAFARELERENARLRAAHSYLCLVLMGISDQVHRASYQSESIRLRD